MAIAASVIAKQIRGQLVIKDGASTGITTGKIIDVTAGVVLVKGNEQTPFSAPGDSGAVVRMKDSDDVVGIVLSITFEEVFGYYTTSAQPIWTFYSTACDAAECAIQVCAQHFFSHRMIIGFFQIIFLYGGIQNECIRQRATRTQFTCPLRDVIFN